MMTSRITCLAFASLMACGSLARAQSPAHLDDLARQAERQARQVLYQSYSLHAHGPVARDLKNDALQMIRLATHIHDVAHVEPWHGHGYGHGRHHRRGGRHDLRQHLNRDVAEMDRLLHHMQDTVADLRSRLAACQPAYLGPGQGQVGISVGRHFSFSFSSYGARPHRPGHGHRPLSSLERIDRSLASLEYTVHHLLEDTDAVCVRAR